MDANIKNNEENTARAKCVYRQKERVIDVIYFGNYCLGKNQNRFAVLILSFL
jgi:hypothetical protein